ncbi:HEAT repeat domain-containing protein [Ruegeria aquimaris]|uniref:HEAT repeat domain-containing protein n=1 Tax=Ruegeria aquimaris TaxID=2984333 RepID=A0ABT3ANQ8_9RHOB|nr:HEAT repeat domain-containing protein [Ruegeria sp. XHP0148]MCV2890309.1 HEAT repeat domain-containing protein [Ruegeria sp. XHP0148]
MENRIVEDVIRAHAEGAAFSWAQFSLASLADPVDRVVIDRRRSEAEAHLDGLRIAGIAAWPILIDQLETYEERGEVFAAALLAFEQSNDRRLRQVLGLSATEEGRVGLRGAVAWAAPELTAGYVREWLDAATPALRWLAVAAFADRHADPGTRLERLLSDPDDTVRALACTAAAKAHRADMVPRLRELLETSGAEVELAAATALLELGHPPDDTLTTPLRRAVLADPGNVDLMRKLVRVSPPEDIRAWFATLLKDSETAPIAVRGAGILGDRTLVPWLVEQMREPTLADAAGRAFLDLFPEAWESWDDLTSLDPKDHGPAFVEAFGGEMEVLPVAEKIAYWQSEHSQ